RCSSTYSNPTPPCRPSRSSRAPPGSLPTWPRSGSARSASAWPRPPRTPSTTTPMLDPDVERRPWAEQLVLDDESFRAQLAYLLERSPFYREKLDRPVGLAEIAELPLTEKAEL